MHHKQAVDMAALVKDRTNNPAVTTAAARISASQTDEMKFMRKWLEGKGEPLAMPTVDQSGQGGHALLFCPMNFSTQVAEQAVHWLVEMQHGALNPRQQAAWQQGGSEVLRRRQAARQAGQA